MSKYQQLKSSTLRKIGRELGQYDATSKIEQKYIAWQAQIARDWAQEKKLERQLSQFETSPEIKVNQKESKTIENYFDMIFNPIKNLVREGKYEFRTFDQFCDLDQIIEV